MAKSDCGLPAHSHATQCQIGKEEQRLRDKYAAGLMSFAQYEKRYKQLLKAGKITRAGRKIGGKQEKIQKG